MSDHRIRLTDEDILLIVSSLRARRAGYAPTQQLKLDYLIARLEEGVRGNPKWTYGVERETAKNTYIRRVLAERNGTIGATEKRVASGDKS